MKADGAARWLVAVPTVLVNLGIGGLALLFVCCGSTPEQNLKNPLCWGSFAGAVLGAVTLPPIDVRLRRRPLRWLTVPFVIGFGVFVATNLAVVERMGLWYFALLAFTGACAALAVVRLVAPGR